MIKLRGPLSVQDEEFLEDIEGLSEGKRNGIIAYVKDKCECIKQENKELLETKRKELKEEVARIATIVGISKQDILEQIIEKIDAVLGEEEGK